MPCDSHRISSLLLRFTDVFQLGYWNVCAQTQTLFSHPTPFLSRVGKMARLIIGEKARGRIESYYIISGKFRGEQASENQLDLSMGLTLSLFYLPLSKS